MTTTLQSIGPGVSAALVDNQESFRLTPGGILVPSVNGHGLWANRNKIHNPCGLVKQRSGMTTPVGSGLTFLCDRWGTYANGIYTGKYNYIVSDDGAVSQVSPRHFGVQCSATVGVPAAGDYLVIAHQFEGADVADLKWGTALARPITIRFRYGINKASIISLSLRNADATRSYCTPIAMSPPAGTVTLTIPGDTSGPWKVAPGEVGLTLWLIAAAPSNGTFTAPTANQWIAGNYISTSSQTSITVANDWLGTTDWELAIGNTPSLYPELRPYAQELAICQRFYEQILLVTSTSPSPSYTGLWKAAKYGLPSVTWAVDVGTGAAYTRIGGTEGQKLGVYQSAPHSVVATATITGSAEI